MYFPDFVLAVLTALHRHNLMQRVLERTNPPGTLSPGLCSTGELRSLLELASNALHVTPSRASRGGGARRFQRAHWTTEPAGPGPALSFAASAPVRRARPR